MASAHLLRLQIEAALSSRIPSALTPAPRVIRPTAPTGIAALDERLGGGLPMGGISELTGPECSGRTSLALSFVAELTGSGRVCAWVDVSDALDPESAAAMGVDLERLLWIRCGEPPQQLALPGFEANPSANEKIVPENFAAKRPLAVRENFAPRCAEPQPTIRRRSREVISLEPVDARRVPHICPVLADVGAHETRPSSALCALSPDSAPRPLRPRKPYSRLDQALRVADLLLQAGGFSAIVIDMGSVAPEFALRVPLATWFRYRAAAERTQASVLLLTQQACTKSSAGVVLHCAAGPVFSDGGAVFTGAEYRVEIARERFAPVTEFSRKPPQSERSVRWQSRTAWAGRS
ncbi:MAG: recombinase RecA [Acidobacteriaceae bacterium]